MSAATTSLFPSNRSQAVREVVIVAGGPRRIVPPADRTWNDFFAGPGVDLGERRQPEAETRDSF